MRLGAGACISKHLMGRKLDELLVLKRSARRWKVMMFHVQRAASSLGGGRSSNNGIIEALSSTGADSFGARTYLQSRGDHRLHTTLATESKYELRAESAEVDKKAVRLLPRNRAGRSLDPGIKSCHGVVHVAKTRHRAASVCLGSAKSG